ncbi:GAF domain-containing protein [Kitasatospora arboriphila]
MLRTTLLTSDDAPVLLAVTDPQGHLLWLDGARHLRRNADDIGFETGARWTEDEVGTNGIGMALRTERPIAVHSAEHYLRSHHAWTCVAAPVRDPRTGRLLGILDLSGPAHQVQPHLMRLTATAARLAETELRAAQLESLHRLRTLATGLLARVSGPALVVDGAAGRPPRSAFRRCSGCGCPPRAGAAGRWSGCRRSASARWSRSAAAGWSARSAPRPPASTN